jgi:small-conductance mechanosensitive channel
MKLASTRRMDEILYHVIGPVAPLLMPLSLAAVVLTRKSIRKRHLVTLFVVTALSMLGFIGVILLGFVYRDLPAFVFQSVLWILAVLMLTCGPAIGFWLILKQLGFVPDEPFVAPPVSRTRRSRR